MKKLLNLSVVIFLTYQFLFVAKVNAQLPAGSLDPTFGTDGIKTFSFGTSWDEAYATAIQSDGKIVTVGHSYPGYQNSFAIVRVNSDGSLDNSFGNAGKVITRVGTSTQYSDEYAKAVAIQSDGKIIVTGYTVNEGADNYDIAVVRYNVDGSLDNTFDSDGIVTTDILGSNDEANAVNVQSDGKIIVAGSTLNGSYYDFAVVRYNQDGSLDNSFGSNGIMQTSINNNDYAYGMAIQSDGKIVIAGQTDLNSTDFAVVRLNVDGSLDNTFDTDGKVTTNFGSTDKGRSVAIQTDGKILVGGNYSSDYAIARYNTDGSLDNTFDTDGKVTTDIYYTDYCFAITLQTNGRIVAAGYSYSGSTYYFSATRYNTNGTLDNTFDTDGKIYTDLGGTDKGESVSIQSNGKIVIAGYTTIGAEKDFAMLRYNTDGGLDATFDTDGKVITNIGGGNDIIGNCALQSNGKIIVTGSIFNGSSDDFGAARLNTDGSLDNTFDSDGKVTTAIGTSSDNASGCILQSDGKIVLGGYTFNGSSYDYALVRYNTFGILDNTFNADGIVTTNINNGDIGKAIALQTDGKIVVAGISGSDFSLARYNVDGSLDNTFDTDGKVTTIIGSNTDYIRTIAIQSDGKIIAAGMTYNGADWDIVIVRYNTNGSLDNTFESDGKVIVSIGSGDDYAYSVNIQPDGKIVVAGFYFNSINDDLLLLRYNSDGTLDDTFGAFGIVTTSIGSGNDYAYAAAIQSDGKIVVTGETYLSSSNSDIVVMRYNSNGTLDNTFGSNGKVITSLGSGGDYGYSVTLQPDAKIIVAGSVYNGNDNDFVVLRYIGLTPVTATISATSNVSCNGGSDGSATVTADAGMPSYTYLWSTSPAQTNATATGLPIGVYTVTVTDNIPNTTTATVTITQPSLLVAAITSSSNSSCTGSSTGTATVTGSGGTPPYTYFWNSMPVQASPTAVNLPAGTYAVTVYDSNGCQDSAQITIDINPFPNVIAGASDNIICLGENIILTGSGALTYIWSNGVTDGISFSPTATTTYTVTGTDSEGCTNTDQIIITVNTLPSANVAVNNIDCFGNSTGTTDLTVNGGTSPYAYLWSNSITTQDLSNMPAGTYSVTVTDNNLCSTTATATITQPAALTANTTIIDVACFGNSTGAVNLNVSGGSSPYTFLWTGGATTQNISGKPAGSYSVTITDAHSCIITTMVTITQPSAALSLNPVVTNVNCYGNSTGAVNLSVSGGTSPYTFLWTGGATTQNISGKPTGTYSVVISDNHSCTATTTVTITQPAAALSANVITTDISGCFGDNTGAIDLTVNGGTSPYAYLWSNSITTQDLSNMPAGTYSVTVTDNNLCSATATATITQPAALTANTTTTDVDCFGNSTGAVNLNVSGGSSPYTFLWTGGETTQNISGKPAGLYSVTITDTHSCTITTTVTITQPVALSITPTITNIDCYGNNNGAVSLLVNGGTVPYTYLWSNSDITQNIDSIPPGIYSVTITDNNSCTSTSSSTITQPTQLSVNLQASSNVSCYGYNDGMAFVMAFGGTPPYSFLWSDGQTSVLANELIAGTYYVTVTDNNFCTDSTTVTITQPPVLPTPVIVQSGDSLYSSSSSGNQWYFEGNLIDSATDSIYIPTETGNYFVIITNSGCSSDTSNILFVNVTGISSMLEYSPVLIYPNPVTYELNLLFKFVHISDVSISIIDNLGRLIDKQEPKKITGSTKSTIDLKNYSDGIYTVNVKVDNKNYNEKIVIIGK